MDKLLTIKEVAEYLKVHINTVRRLISKKQLPALKAGWQWRVRETDLETFVKKQIHFIHDSAIPQMYFRYEVLEEYRRESGKYYIQEAGFHGRLGNKEDRYYAHHDRSVLGAAKGLNWSKDAFGKDDFLEKTDGFPEIQFYKVQLKSGKWAIIVDPRAFYRMPEAERSKWQKYEIINPQI